MQRFVWTPQEDEGKKVNIEEHLANQMWVKHAVLTNLHQFAGSSADGLSLQLCRDVRFMQCLWFRGKFENQQCRRTEVCDCSSRQQRALCVNLKKEGRGFGN